jgi:peptide/nickel transport system permease protein
LSRRLLQGILVMFLVSAATFFLINLAPGGPSSLMNLNSTAQQRAALEQQLGLNRPIFLRYLNWLGAALQGRLGNSLSQGEPVAPLLAQRLRHTALLAGTALLLVFIFGVALGIWSARKRGRPIDHLVGLVSTLGMSLPEFWLGTLLIMLFSVRLHFLPASGMLTVGAPWSLSDLLVHLLMPALVLSFVLLPNVVRFARSALLEVMEADYVRTARSKGLRERAVLLRHALRNAWIPIIAMLGLILPQLLSGSVVVESVFAWPGMGRLAVQAAMNRDYPVIMATTVLAAAIVILTNILIDLLYSLVDPRVVHA